ncbi:MAG: hypothetical protein LUD69_02060, partial [Oscillospiraceae bacterium]|nr:hypothetical protein [Oscillospiraceae bacterium]
PGDGFSVALVQNHCQLPQVHLISASLERYCTIKCRNFQSSANLSHATISITNTTPGICYAAFTSEIDTNSHQKRKAR